MNQELSLPPQAVELEEAILGAIMLSSENLDIVSAILPSDSFYKHEHSIIYKEILGMYKRGEKIDILTVSNALQRSNKLSQVGGAYYISMLTNRVASSTNMEFHSRIVAQKYISREMIKQCSEIISKAYSDSMDIFELTDYHIKNVSKIIDSVSQGKTMPSMEQLIEKEMDLYDARSNASSNRMVNGIPSGFYDIDTLTGGWQNSDLIILGARPSMGKTSLMLCFALNCAMQGTKVKIFSLETSAIKLVQRLLLIMSELNPNEYKRGTLNVSDVSVLNNERLKLAELGIEIDDTSAISVQYASSEVRKWEMSINPKNSTKDKTKCIVMADYLGLFKPEETRGVNREQQISGISAGLKRIAKDNDLPFICLSQLSRAVEQRPDKRPMLSDLRDSGSIEQDADVIMFIYRPEYYGIEQDANGNSTQGLSEILFEKHRDGALDTINLTFDNQITKFKDINDQSKNQSYSNTSLKPNTSFYEVEKEEEPF